ncbi:tRNA-splicing endonuclease subunit sen54 [Serendipita sp. 411]|nr:tRNA-splicing endonuclease subunit sen54 [Serendipita sp. 411]
MWFGSGFGEHLLHMDEAAESPVATLGGDNDIPEEDKADSGDDDQMLDWSKLGLVHNSLGCEQQLTFRSQKASKSNRSLPKRGEKAFEPIATGPSAYQKHTLDLARRAMYDVLSAPREIQTKRLSQAIWIPTLSRAHIVENRGSIFNSLGYTIRRPGNTSKRLELLPEETLYLIERGSMLCWKEAPGLYEQLQDQDEQDPIKPLGTPMSVQQCFTDMLGVQDTTMERYQVYSYLKRFGYIVRRAQTLTGSPEYTIYRHPPMKLGWYHYFQQRINIIFSSFKGLLRIDWWARFHPSVVSYWKRALHYRKSSICL